MDYSILKKLHDDHIELKLKEMIPDKNTYKIRNLISFLRDFYSTYSIDKIKTLTIIYDDINIEYLSSSTAHCCTLETMKIMYSKNITIQLLSNNSMYIWDNISLPDDFKKKISSIIYELNDNEEYFYINSNKQLLEKSCLGSRSVFAEPTFTELDEALNKYYDLLAMTSKCLILKDVWVDERRLRLKSAPENDFRDSLYQFLISYLRRTSNIKKEQNVTDRHPIDIRVIWQNSSEKALIEIKWLGSSFNECGKKTKEYNATRINKGAKQLVDYLDESSEQEPYSFFKGYLVVYDARRKKVNTDLQLSEHTLEDSWYYKDTNNEEQLTAEFHKKECKYIRFYLEPQPEKRKFSYH